MAKSPFPQELIDRVTKRRGRFHAFETIEPARTALLVVDMQNYFLEPGQACEVPAARAIVPNIDRLAAAARRAGATVVWILMTQSPAEMKRWSVFYDHLNAGARGIEEMHRLSEGDQGHAIWPEFRVEPDDIKVRKTRYSAFIQGSSDLESVLRDRGIDTVIVTGTTTNTCCQSTALDAAMLNFKVIFAADGTAAMSEAAHEATLYTILNTFGDVRMTDEIVPLLAAGARGRAAAE